MSTTEKRAVKFLQSWRGYSAGEIAGFDEKVAVQLVKSKVAEEYSAEGEKAPPTQNQPKAPAQRAPAASKRGSGKADTPAPAPASGEGSAPAPAPASGEGSAPDGSADPGAGTADTSNPAGAEGSQTDPTAAAAGIGGSADNDDRP